MRDVCLWPFYQFYNPKRVLVFCALFLFSSLLFNGSFANLFFLMRQKGKVLEQVRQMSRDNLETEKKIQQAKDPQFVTREAIEKFDMVNEKDLVFIFPDE